MAAYIWLTSRSQAKFPNNEIESHSILHAQQHLRRFCLTFTSILALLVIGCESDTHWTSGLSQAFRSLIRSQLVAVTLLASRSTFSASLLNRNWLYSVFVGSRPLLTRWQSHVTGPLPRNRSWSSPGACTIGDGAIHTTVASSAVWRKDWGFAHRLFLVKFARIGCLRHRKRQRKLFSRNASARRQRQRGRLKRRRKWTTPLNSMLQKKEFKPCQPNVGMMGRPIRRRERSQPVCLRLRRQSLPTNLPSPMTPRPRLRRQCLMTSLPGPEIRRSPCQPACLWWEVPGPTAAQCLPGPVVLNTIDDAVVTGADEVMGQTDTTTRQGPATRPDVVGVGSGPCPRHWEGPALEPSTRIQRMFWGLVVRQRGQRRSDLPAQPLVIKQDHHRIVGPGRDLGSMTDVRVWTVWGLGLLTYPDEKCNCPQQFHRRLRRELSLWFPRLPDQLLTWQVWRARPTRQGWWARQTRTTQQATSQQEVSDQKWTTRVRLSNCCQLSTASGPGRCRLSRPTESSRQRLGTSTWLSMGWLGTTTRLGTWWLDKEWRPSSPGYSGRDCTSRITGQFHCLRCQQSHLPICAEENQPGDVIGLHVNVDSHAT